MAMVTEDDVPYYYEGLDRRGSMGLLRTKGTHRSFLIRDSQSVPGSFVLSFRVDPFVRNFTIVKQMRNGQVTYTIGNRHFRNLPDVVEHYRTAPLSDNLCLGDPVIDQTTQGPPSPSGLSTGGTTTHSSRIRCYDFPSVVLKRQQQGSKTPSQGASPARPVNPPGISAAETTHAGTPPSQAPPIPRRIPSLTPSHVPTPPVPLQPNINPTQFHSQTALSTPLSTQNALLLSGSPSNGGVGGGSGYVPFSVLMEDPSTRAQFEEWLESERMEENILFLTSCEQYKNAVQEAIEKAEGTDGPEGQQSMTRAQELAREIFIKFMTPASMYEVNISVTTVRAARQALDSAGKCDPLERSSRLLGVFDEAYTQIYEMLGRDAYPRYLEWREMRERRNSN